MSDLGRVFLVDYGVYLFSAIFSARNNPQIPAMYTLLRSMFSNLVEVGATPHDTVIIACDGRKSWRKEHDQKYKEDRREKREAYTDIDWDMQFAESDVTIQNLRDATPFYPIKIDRLEADDVIAEAVRYYIPRECVILSCDADYEQLTAYSNVKIFSNKSRSYKIVTNPYAVLAKKIRKEAADNLHEEITTEEEFATREAIVSLLHLPQWVGELVKPELDRVSGEKTFDSSRLRYASLMPYMEQLLDDALAPKTTYEKSVAKIERKKKRQSKRLKTKRTKPQEST